MFKKKWKSIFLVANLVVIIVALLMLCMFMFNKYRSSILIDLTNRENDVNMQKNILESDANYEKFVSSVQSDTKIVLITVNGKYAVTHDKTRKSNDIFEWFSTSKIEIDCDYSVCFVIDTSNLKFTRENGLKICYSENDIYINSLTITNSIASEIRALFGKSYSTNEIIALQSVLKEKILAECSSDESNLEKAKASLELYLYDLANSLGINIEVCEK